MKEGNGVIQVGIGEVLRIIICKVVVGTLGLDVQQVGHFRLVQG